MRQEKKHEGDGETQKNRKADAKIGRGARKRRRDMKRSRKKTWRQGEKQEEDVETGGEAGRRHGDRRRSRKKT